MKGLCVEDALGFMGILVYRDSGRLRFSWIGNGTHRTRDFKKTYRYKVYLRMISLLGFKARAFLSGLGMLARFTTW